MAHYKKRTKRKVFSKREKQAIVRIAQQPVETKHYDQNWDWGALLTVAGYTSGDRFALVLPIYHNIPRDSNTSEVSENSFIGNEIMLRGFRFELHAFMTTAAAVPDAKLRITIYSEQTPRSSLPYIISGSDTIIDPDFINVPTWFRWNMQVAKIHMQRNYTLTASSTGSGVLNKKFYWKSGRKLTSETEEGVVLGSTFGTAKNYNTYCMMEFLSPTLGTLTTSVTGNLNLSTYFKDA